jgi:hypothetical protein
MLTKLRDWWNGKNYLCVVLEHYKAPYDDYVRWQDFTVVYVQELQKNMAINGLIGNVGMATYLNSWDLREDLNHN